MNQEQMIEGEDYYLDDEGLFVFTAKYLSDRGYCCGNGCLNCPFNYQNVPEPKRSILLNSKTNKNSTGG